MEGKTNLFRNKYRILPSRLAGWNYGQSGSYFITVCAKNRINYFGHIRAGQMIWSELGRLAKLCWQMIPNHFPQIKLDVFVVMPDHVHGIIHIIHNKKSVGPDGPDVGPDGPDVGPDGPDVETQNFASLRVAGTITNQCYKNKFGSQSKNISSIIRGYKIGVTLGAKNINKQFKWQERFYDRVIRNQGELSRIRNYIINNPKCWSPKNR
ncbi:hypothetical protein COX22_03400 [Candidatus Falkowbacteria bacterium CG23_combo_of_CG06-09_8_20_14_all_49_15]|uniref:Transposase IS200-like domain-containing protein n=1 Tax=Candidatus Falkowbacteria bacterium CG23_combo_of_CG06-09_8_20_14_all_49_15 TaxID=1974572 RepID=A0A2G9ZKE3_9BACT|nr:MAG: hypothetical protein COX22_03400 [Candidatus Falkowbacteria bacterium CG23_combo_of_CG06-09_8_20_14_all_49_15]